MLDGTCLVRSPHFAGSRSGKDLLALWWLDRTRLVRFPHLLALGCLTWNEECELQFATYRGHV